MTKSIRSLHKMIAILTLLTYLKSNYKIQSIIIIIIVKILHRFYFTSCSKTYETDSLLIQNFKKYKSCIPKDG